MLRIGITGNIGSGKTTVSKVFELLGVPVFYADYHAKKVMTEDVVLIKAIQNTFGEEAYFDDGSLNRKYISSIVFNNDAELNKLNALVHPAVFRAFDKWAEQFNANFYVLKEAAILFESGSNQQCDKTIVVSASLDVRVKRVMQRDHLTEEEVLRREKKQMPQAEKEAKANFIIFNNPQTMVIPQVLEIHQKLLALAQKAWSGNIF
ncbi:dephospho-CoA kinase [Mucilaginibacter arboris]|uniref:Dephospho-CoA kinase n=1 Tax=Mucilaginibacter arboris TaxID=2682090 RepID=A0A7K1SZH7_9SPHI|nr:dephospho-CoA kinase [Mucilaginibacter arboris]MVN22726.1 dephospho-CoA kinase [Mucilaginibacter arboris]